MKVKHSILLVLAVSVVGSALTYWYMNSRSWAVAPVAAMETKPAASLVVTTAQPAKRLFTLRVPWIGTVEPKAAVAVVALAAGRVDAIEAKDRGG
jgi:multidrug efflux pump subunit AcrA (membrane-fusion protein)